MTGVLKDLGETLLTALVMTTVWVLYVGGVVGAAFLLISGFIAWGIVGMVVWAFASFTAAVAYLRTA